VCDRCLFGYVELDARLWNPYVIGPRRDAEACLSRLSEGPNPEVVAAADLLAGEVVAVKLFERKPECVHIQLAALSGSGCDDRDAGNELDLHEVTSRYGVWVRR